MTLSTKLMASAALAMLLSSPLSAQEHLKSLNPDYINNQIPAKTNFYNHITDGWQKANPLTDEYSRYGQFNILQDSSQNRVKNLVLSLSATNPQRGTVAQKVATLYEQGMDSVRRNKEGNKILRPLLKKVERTSHSRMNDLFLWIQTYYGSPFISAGIEADLTNSNAYAMYIQGEDLYLGDRDYYLPTSDAHTQEVLQAYKNLIVEQMQNAGYSLKDATRIMNNVIKIETEIAKETMTREESRDIVAMYNPCTIQELKDTYNNLPWDSFFTTTMGIDTPSNYIVATLKSAAKGNELFSSTTDREKKDLYLWMIVRNAAPYLSDSFTDANFKFSKVISGVSQQRPRWKRSLATTERVLGEAIGELYVDKYFPQSSKDYMINLVENLRTALASHINNLPWMSDATKVNALKKLNSFTVKIGYPDQWKDYSDLQIDPELTYYQNIQNANQWAVRDLCSKWGKPVDKSEWGMTPQTINAYYNPMNNEIVFPAGILQAPFFSPEASDAENYGGIGVVIGHEMTHGFDDQGCNFDADGNMVNWWTDEDSAKFQEMTQGLAAQFSEVEVLPGLHANGQYTLGENIADQGGLRIALTAFLNAQEKKGIDVNSPEANIDGFTPLQVFYMNYANLWAQNIRDEEIRNLTNSDPHSLGCNRVNVTLRNIDPFFQAFGIQEGDPMFRPAAQRIVIW